MRHAILIALTACGRIGFDMGAPADTSPDVLSPDVLLGHDEDGDGIADLVDVCPHIVSAQDDTDGDQIGDACDPEPANPRQRLVLFATLQPDDQPLQMAGGWTQLADSLRFDGNLYGSLQRFGNLGSVRVAVGVDIGAALGVGVQHQLALGASPSTLPDYFVELRELGIVSEAAITEEDTGSYRQLASEPLVMRMHPGRAWLQATYDIGAGTMAMAGGWDGEPYSLLASSPSYAGATGVGLGINNLVIEVRYMWIVEW